MIYDADCYSCYSQINFNIQTQTTILTQSRFNKRAKNYALWFPTPVFGTWKSSVVYFFQRQTKALFLVLVHIKPWISECYWNLNILKHNISFSVTATSAVIFQNVFYWKFSADDWLTRYNQWSGLTQSQPVQHDHHPSSRHQN